MLEEREQEPYTVIRICRRKEKTTKGCHGWLMSVIARSEKIWKSEFASQVGSK